MIDQTLSNFVALACPLLPKKSQDDLVKELKEAFTRWALAEPDERKRSLEFSLERVKRRLGIAVDVPIELAFSKRQVPDAEAAKVQAKKFVNAFGLAIVKQRKGRATADSEFRFKIRNVDTKDSKLVFVSLSATGLSLTKSELRKGTGMLDRRKAGRPAMVQLGSFSSNNWEYKETFPS